MVVVVVQRDRDVLVREAGGVARGDKVFGQDWGLGEEFPINTNTRAGGEKTAGKGKGKK